MTTDASTTRTTEQQQQQQQLISPSTGSSNSSSNNSAAITALPTPIKGKGDWRDFRCFRIKENGVTVCLVHDKESKTTAAAATVNAGAAADPRSLPGLVRVMKEFL